MKQTTRDNLIYLSAGLTIFAALLLYILLSERMTGKIQKISGPILWGIFSTPVIIGLILEEFWIYRRQRSLWLILGVAASVNISVVLAAYRFQWQAPLIVWSTTAVLLVTATHVVASKVVTRNHNRS
jgi:hypothetical protein